MPDQEDAHSGHPLRKELSIKAMFYYLLSLLYMVGMCFLLHELRGSTAAQRRKQQTIPLLLAATICYVAIMLKTYRLSMLFAIR